MKTVAILFTAGACLIIMKWPKGEIPRATRVEPTKQADSRPTHKRVPAAVAPPAPMTPKIALEKAALAEQLTPRENVVFSSPDKNPWERKLKLGFIARHHANTIPGGEELGGLYVEEMKNEPAAAFEAIKSLLTKLSPREYPIDRASLIDVAADLPGFREEAKQLARNEIHTAIVETKTMPSGPDVTEEQMNGALSSDDFELLPMVSHAVLMRTANDRDEALRLTLEAISAQRDPGIRETIANQFLAKYPDAKADLYSAIQLARLEMPREMEN